MTRANEEFERQFYLCAAILKWQESSKCQSLDFDWKAILGHFEGDLEGFSDENSRINECMRVWNEIRSGMGSFSAPSSVTKAGTETKKRKAEMIKKELNGNDLVPALIFSRLPGAKTKVMKAAGVTARSEAREESALECVIPEHYSYSSSILLLSDPVLSTSDPGIPRRKRGLSSQTAASNPLSTTLLFM